MVHGNTSSLCMLSVARGSRAGQNVHVACSCRSRGLAGCSSGGGRPSGAPVRAGAGTRASSVSLRPCYSQPFRSRGVWPRPCARCQASASPGRRRTATRGVARTAGRWTSTRVVSATITGLSGPLAGPVHSGSGGAEQAQFEQVQVGPPHHGPLEHSDPVHLPLHRPELNGTVNPAVTAT